LEKKLKEKQRQFLKFTVEMIYSYFKGFCFVLHFPYKKKDEIYLNLIMEYMSNPLSKVIRDKRKRGDMMAIEDIKLYAY